jgi:hypothetical protein
MGIARKFKRQAERLQPQAPATPEGEETPGEVVPEVKPKPDMASFTNINSRVNNTLPVARKAARRGTMRGK